jgi:protein O-GlcNAc transferase
VAARVNLAGLRRLEGRLEEAAQGCHVALQYQPDCAEAYSTLGAILQAQGRLDDALAAMERAVVLKPDSAALHSSFLGTLHYCPDITVAKLYEAHEGYERRHAAPWRTSWPEHRNPRDPDRPLRVGFVSPHFARHPVGYFLIRALEHLDRCEGQVVCYSDTMPADDLTARFKAVASLWREVVGKTDEELARQIQADGIDILFDLAGHTGGNRLLTFARKPAPVQITWIDYEGTTGLGATDYLVADRYVVPAGSERWFAEKILRMPDGFVCYEPPAGAPAVGPLPAQACGRVTLGSINQLGKITPEVIATWARILHRLPEARLMIKYHGLDDPPTRAHFEQQFAGRGIAGERLVLEGWSPYAEFLKRYLQIDIALDPFPYTGGLTTCEALWMGVPVVTLLGETFASRHGLSHLSNIGLSENIARDKDHYVDLTVELACDLPRLASIRAGLRQQMASSPLCDGQRFATNLTALLRDVWRQWVAKSKPSCQSGPE